MIAQRPAPPPRHYQQKPPEKQKLKPHRSPASNDPPQAWPCAQSESITPQDKELEEWKPLSYTKSAIADKNITQITQEAVSNAEITVTK